MTHRVPIAETIVTGQDAPEQVVRTPAAAEPTLAVPEPVIAAEVPESSAEVVVEHEDELPPSVVEEQVLPPADSVLAAYGQFDGTVVQVAGTSRRELLDGLVRLVEAEGPVLGSRLHTAYVRASGAIRVTKLVGGELNKAIAQAVREGQLVEDNPLGESGVKPRTYRLPDQPEVRMTSSAIDLEPRPSPVAGAAVVVRGSEPSEYR